MKVALLNFVRGLLIGVANIIPGVSGGTMALMLGIYERLISAINGLGSEFARDCVQLVKQPRQNFRTVLAKYDLVFLASLSTGALLAIVLLSRLITYLMSAWHEPTYAFFFGLVLISVVVPWQMLKQKRPRFVGLLVLAVTAVLTVGLTLSMSGEDKVKSEQRKIELKSSSVVASAADSVPQRHSASQLLFLALCGSLAVAAMILPGISGSFVLLVLGVYFEILAAIAMRDFSVIAAVALGCIAGLLAFTRLLQFLLAHHHDTTVMALIGLMLGSLYGVWPFQKFEMVGEKRIDLHPIIPDYDQMLMVSLLSFLSGCLLVLGFIFVERFFSAKNR